MPGTLVGQTVLSCLWSATIAQWSLRVASLLLPVEVTYNGSLGFQFISEITENENTSWWMLPICTKGRMFVPHTHPPAICAPQVDNFKIRMFAFVRTLNAHHNFQTHISNWIRVMEKPPTTASGAHKVKGREIGKHSNSQGHKKQTKSIKGHGETLQQTHSSIYLRFKCYLASLTWWL